MYQFQEINNKPIQDIVDQMPFDFKWSKRKPARLVSANMDMFEEPNLLSLWTDSKALCEGENLYFGPILSPMIDWLSVWCTYKNMYAADGIHS